MALALGNDCQVEVCTGHVEGNLLRGDILCDRRLKPGALVGVELARRHGRQHARSLDANRAHRIGQQGPNLSQPSAGPHPFQGGDGGTAHCGIGIVQ